MVSFRTCLILLLAGPAALAQGPATERALVRTAGTLQERLGAATFRQHFRPYRDASYRVFAHDSYYPLDGEGDPGLPVRAYELSYIVSLIAGRDTVPLGVLTLRADSSGRLLPPRAGQPPAEAALAAWSALFRGRLAYGLKEVLRFRRVKGLRSYRVLYECRDPASARWYWYLVGPTRIIPGGTEFTEYRIDPRTGRRTRTVIRPPVEKSPPVELDLRGEPAPAAPAIDSLRGRRLGK
ncbi:MAG: hypothetical protein EOO16_14580 [Chitinophagaceae bacterium]|nr:MAG: hypothetical protein EOO16_14580 [Chitinophagaceae bacterium]